MAGQDMGSEVVRLTLFEKEKDKLRWQASMSNRENRKVVVLKKATDF